MQSIPGGIPILKPAGQPEQMATYVKTPDGRTIAMPFVTVGMFDQNTFGMLVGTIAEAVYQRIKQGDNPAPGQEVPVEGENVVLEGDSP